VENARGLGAHLAQWLAARGERVDDVPRTATARVRELSRGGRRKNDVIDAATAASVAARAGDATPVLVEDSSTVFALLDERRANLAAHRTRLVNQLHALLRELIPGGADTDLTADRAARALATVRSVGPAETVRKQIGRDLIAEIRDLDARLAKLSTQMTQTLAEHGNRLTDVDGIGPIVATRLLGRTGPASRFPSSSAFASYAGVAPIEVASADRARHRLPRGGELLCVARVSCRSVRRFHGDLRSGLGRPVVWRLRVSSSQPNRPEPATPRSHLSRLIVKGLHPTRGVR
jgi:transposase